MTVSDLDYSNARVYVYSNQCHYNHLLCRCSLYIATDLYEMEILSADLVDWLVEENTCTDIARQDLPLLTRPFSTRPLAFNTIRLTRSLCKIMYLQLTNQIARFHYAIV